MQVIKKDLTEEGKRHRAVIKMLFPLIHDLAHPAKLGRRIDLAFPVLNAGLKAVVLIPSRPFDLTGQQRPAAEERSSCGWLFVKVDPGRGTEQRDKVFGVL
jgi:hypothetical protein